MAPPLANDPIALARDNWRKRGWTDAADGMALVTSIMRIQQDLLSQVDSELRVFGLTFARYEVLMLLEFSREGKLPLGKIGERLQVHPASVTNVVHTSACSHMRLGAGASGRRRSSTAPRIGRLLPRNTSTTMITTGDSGVSRCCGRHC